MILLGYFSAVLVGLVLGLMGGGGSILAVPIFVYLWGTAPAVATTYSLFVVGLTSLVGVVGYLREGSIDATAGAVYLAPSLLGISLVRRWLLPAIPMQIFELDGFLLTKDRLILLVFALVMSFAAYSMLRKPKPAEPRREPSYPLLSLFGLLTGAVVGFVGAGGGFLIIPVLVRLAKMEMKLAVGTSLFVIALSSLFGFASDWERGNTLDWPVLLLFTTLSVLGLFIGLRLSKKVSSAALKKAFGMMILAVAVLILVKEVLFQ